MPGEWKNARLVPMRWQTKNLEEPRVPSLHSRPQ